MKPEVFYFAAYICVLDEKIYDEYYFKMTTLLQQEAVSSDVHTELLKILGDDESKVSLDAVLNVLKNAADSDKDAAMALGVSAALADDYWSDDEEKFFKDACAKIEYPVDKFQKLCTALKAVSEKEVSDDVTITKKIYGKTFYALLSKIAPGTIKELFKQRYVNCLLSGTDYSDAIKAMRHISREDITYARGALEKMNDAMDVFLRDLDATTRTVKRTAQLLKRTHDDETENVEQFLDGIKKQILEFVHETKQTVAVSLKEKEIAAKYYTISFMGRTKAGKSTLHSFILGGINKEFIGIGKERTTRFNRIYKWNGIRIIDTPGIGAPGGKSDTEIARSIVEESDLICYVVTSDSIQETEFAFLKELKNQNKPIVILLNKKENLNHPIHKKKFLENPLYWYERKDTDSIEGHLTRIKEYAEKYYNNTYFDIYPVQLLAAQLAINETDAERKQKFYHGSRLQHFLDTLRVQILDNGKIKRSQTMLNGTIYSLGTYKHVCAARLNELNAMKTSLEEHGKVAIEKIKKAGKTTAASLKEGIESIFNSFIQEEIRSFANAHYTTKRTELNSQWEQFLAESRFESRINKRVKQEIELYKNAVENIIQTFSENITFAFENCAINFNAKNTFDTKGFIQIGSGLLNVVGGIILLISASNPVGWVILGIGVVGTLIANVFKSKEKKIKEAQDALYTALVESFETNRNETVGKITADFKKTAHKTESLIETLFKTITEKLHAIILTLQPVHDVADKYEAALNKVYALRVLNFAIGKDAFSVHNDSLLNRVVVVHDFAKELIIKTDLLKKVNTKKLSRILQEDVVLEDI